MPARDILHAVNFPPDTSNHRSLTENLLLALAMTSDTDTTNGDRKAIPWLLWSIWKNRNAILYSGVQESIAFITQRAITDAATWTSINYPPTTTEDAGDTLGITKTWQRPEPGIVKCNVHAHWRNDTSLIGGAWISRDHHGNVLHHTRDALMSAPNRVTMELKCTIWVLQNVKDLGFRNVRIGLDLCSAFQAISNAKDWPRYRQLLHQLESLRRGFHSVSFEQDSSSTNIIARHIAQSVLRDGR